MLEVLDIKSGIADGRTAVVSSSQEVKTYLKMQSGSRDRHRQGMRKKSLAHVLGVRTDGNAGLASNDLPEIGYCDITFSENFAVVLNNVVR